MGGKIRRSGRVGRGIFQAHATARPRGIKTSTASRRARGPWEAAPLWTWLETGP
jgi:hypothetical protein